MAAVAVVSLGLLAGAPAFAQIPGVPTTPENDHQLPVRINSPKQRQKDKLALRDYNFQQLKKHAKRLSEMAASLEKQIDESNANVLSLKIVKKAAQIEKLARKIKTEAKSN